MATLDQPDELDAAWARTKPLLVGCGIGAVKQAAFWAVEWAYPQTREVLNTAKIVSIALQFVPTIEDAYRAYDVGEGGGVVGSLIGGGVSAGFMALQYYLDPWPTYAMLTITAAGLVFAGISSCCK